MPAFRLTLEYDGSAFAGWQVQPGGQRTVQGELEAALRRLVGARVPVVGAGRTDAGVHAEGQVASFRAQTPLAPGRLREALNGVLPEDIAVRACEPAPAGFHARFDARGKLYRYRIWNARERSPLRAARWHHVRTPLDLGAMRAGAAALAGTHDFASFQASGGGARESVRTLRRIELAGAAGGELWLDVEGDGFLRHMVRILAGTLVEVGLGRREARALPAVLAARDRRAAGRTAPAAGLTLVRVDYAPAAGGPLGPLGPPPPEEGFA